MNVGAIPQQFQMPQMSPDDQMYALCKNYVKSSKFYPVVLGILCVCALVCLIMSSFARKQLGDAICSVGQAQAFTPKLNHIKDKKKCCTLKRNTHRH